MTVRKIFIRFCNNIRHFSNEINKRGGWIAFCGGWNFSKSLIVDSTFIREMRVLYLPKIGWESVPSSLCVPAPLNYMLARVNLS